MRFCSLGSGSSGNGTLVEARSALHTTRVLVDCGFSLRELTRRLALRGLAPFQIDAVFVTHEHSDHVGCAMALCRRHGVALITSEGTWRAMRAKAEGFSPLWARDGEAIALGALELLPFAVPHDAGEPLQISFSDGASRLGVATDLGEPAASVMQRLQSCDALIVECNHDAALLADGPYPAFLKRRVGGPLGHLANHQGAALLRGCRHGRLRHVVAAHLSRQNNRPDLAALALAEVLGSATQDIVVASDTEGTPWLSLR